MTTASIPEIADLNDEQLLTLRTAIDLKLDEIRADYIQRCAALGLTCSNGEGKKRKPRASAKHTRDSD
jgi:hypothetical protein